MVATIEREGVGVGAAELGRRFAHLPRREVAEILAAQPRSAAPVRLEWRRAGAVWAADFTRTPCRVDGRFGRLLLVRDLTSGVLLTAQPSLAESASEVELALAELFARHGPPLVCKLDNGPGFVSDRVRSLCRGHEVLILYSPPYAPSYNGSCEAGCGGLKNRTRRIAAAAGRLTAWTSDDVELARLQANHCLRDRGTRRHSPAERWAARESLAPLERRRFLSTYQRLEHEQRHARAIPSNRPLPRAQQAIIDRAAIPAALREHDLLIYRRD